ncbi:MAG: bifunctional UDP-N-acetylmuramoyl-tripeptide:D-alanyl-D-alanine ligase/alanine racemase [Bacteroidetes bacterium]|nr:bifunctional UDP-N-acetylmuramoyl-tripeptide:D-alanyl-D-alanine ligase/alanine racemase [Bacteroidota bacterium]
MPVFNHSISEISRIVKGKIIQSGSEETLITDLLTDSRRMVMPEGCLFFALVSKRNDGHKYIEDLYSRGVRNFIVEKEPDNLLLLHEANLIQVKDSLQALQMLAAAHRRQFNIEVIGITGSNGKTIVKEWLYQLMYEDRNIVRSPKSFNSQVGVPLSVWQMNDTHELAIFEAGISEPDEMDKLQPIIYPTIGIFTNLGHAHDENFINRNQKTGEKLKLFTKVEILVYSPDQKELQEGILKSGILKNIRAFTWSRNQKADLVISKINHQSHFTAITGEYLGNKSEITIPFIDEASVENAIHCWSTMLILGYQQEVITRKMRQLQPVAMRLEMKEGINNCTIINDSYNSDIDSLAIALDFLNQQKQHRRKTVILSDILQSGRSDSYLYPEIANLLELKHIDSVIGIGKAISKQASAFKMEKQFFPSTADFLGKFPLSSFSNETILLKGARIFEFEQISEALQQKTHETVLEINLGAIVHNLNYYRSLLRPGVKLMAMVKAFSYGSGSFEIANLLQFHQVDYLTVAYADEGVELRKAGINLPIMVMNPDQESFDSMLKHKLEPEIYSFRILRLLQESLSRFPESNASIGVHIKIDTGMRRLGFDPKEMEELVVSLKESPTIRVVSVFSHLAGSDSADFDDFTNYQINSFREASDQLTSAFEYPILRHIANTAGITRFNDAQFDMVRLGIGLYGIAPMASEQQNLLNVSTLKSSISQIKQIGANETVGYSRAWSAEKDACIGIVPIGYADGLSRRLSNGRGHFMLNGHVVPIIGNVCMDMCMIDITDIPAREGDEVIIFGKDMPISRLAEEMESIPYEILTGISRRVKRVYFEE